jgi:iron complex outermembrane receptor protein
LLALCQLPSLAQQCHLSLTGHVHSSIAHENLQNAVVHIQPLGRRVVTDQNGNFRFDSLCSGIYVLEVIHAGHQTISREVRLDKSVHADLDLLPSAAALNMVTVQAQRGITNTGLKSEISGSRLASTRGLSLGEVLGTINGVSILKTGSTISKPVIHGLHGNRLLLINNGVRQEGQQWGNEHAPELDPFIASRITVIKGVDELRYGSDAIGGVILVDPAPLRTTEGYQAELNSVYFSNNRQYVFSGSFEQQLKSTPSFTYRLQGTLKRAANVATPNYRLNNTAFNEQSFSAAAIWRKSSFSSELFYSFFQTKLGVFKGSHIGNTSDLERRIRDPKPDPTFTGQNTYRIERPMQDVQHQLLKARTIFNANNSRFTLQLAGQYNNRNEFDIVRTNITGPQLDLSLITLSQDIGWEQTKRKPLIHSAGIALVQQYNRYEGRYVIPKYNAYNAGAYYIGKWSLEDWDIQAGLRYDYRHINTNRLSVQRGVFDVYDFNFSTAASSLNIGYRLNEHWRANALLSFARRAPQVNELLSNGIHHGSAVFEVGNIDLKPENALNLAVNSNYANATGTIKADVSLYRNSIQQFIYMMPVPGSPELTIAGAFPKRIFTQTDALLYGGDASLSIQLHKNINWQSKLSLLRAKDATSDSWLILMPADRMQQELNINLGDSRSFQNNSIGLQVVKVWRQTRVPSERDGPKDYSPAPAGYTLVNVQLGTDIRIKAKSIHIGVTMHNLLNVQYREYLNAQRYFADEMGRDISIRIKIPFEKNTSKNKNNDYEK